MTKQSITPQSFFGDQSEDVQNILPDSNLEQKLIQACATLHASTVNDVNSFEFQNIHSLRCSPTPLINPIRSFSNISLYGCGALGEMAIDLLHRCGYSPLCMIDENPKLHGLLFHGVPIYSIHSIPQSISSNCTIAICIANFPIQPIHEQLRYAGCVDIRHFYDISEWLSSSMNLGNGWYLPTPSETDWTNIAEVISILDDEPSKAAYLQFLFWHIRRREMLFNMAPVCITDKFLPTGLIDAIAPDFHLVDVGAYDGVVIRKFLHQTQNQFGSILAFEPDPDNRKKLKQYHQEQPNSTQSRFTILECALGNTSGIMNFVPGRGFASKLSNERTVESIRIAVKTLDQFNKSPCTYLKIHAEGHELQIIRGGLEYIKTNRPIIAATIYHNSDGMWKIPLFLKKHLFRYTLHIRLHSFGGTGAVIYAIPI